MNYNDSLVLEGKRAKASWRERDSNPRYGVKPYTRLAGGFSTGETDRSSIFIARVAMIKESSWHQYIKTMAHGIYH